MKERRYDIDWVRVVATLAVFVLHCGRFFDTIDWHLKNAQQSDILTLFQAWLDLWMMPLLFLLSGLGSWYSLRSRSSGQYLFERVKRLLIPFYTVGIFILLPPQFYFDLVSHGRYVHSIWKVIPPYWDSSGSFRLYLDEPYLTNLWPGHLWFLQFLFTVSLLILPLLLYLKSEPGQRLIARLAGWSDRWGGIFLFLIPLVVVRVALTHFFRGQEHSWAHFLYFAVFFVIGYIIPADERFTEGIKKMGWVCLVLGIIGLAAEGVFLFVLNYNYANLHHPGGEPFSLTYVLFNTAMSIASWSWVAFVLSLGMKYLNVKSKLVTYGNEAVLPFYIFHQTIILCVGWFVIRWNIDILPKYVVIAVTSFALIMALYEMLVRRFNVMRFFFGMQPKKKPSVTSTPLPEGTAA